MSGAEAAATANLHASTVALGPFAGLLIRGPSGSGKSQLALALIERGAQLVADDRSIVIASEGALHARAPRPIFGLIEARGLGILRLPALRLARLCLVVDLGGAEPARHPEPSATTICGLGIPRLEGRADAAFAGALLHVLQAFAAGAK